MQAEAYRQVLLLQRLGALFLELERQSRVPFAVRSSGLETAVAGVCGLLEGEDWIYPDPRTGWACAVLRGQSLEQHLHQWLATGKDAAQGRMQPGFGGHPAGRVVPVTGQLGVRAGQALGSAWAAPEGGLAVCWLGPSELARPEAFDALRRAAELKAPLLGVLLGTAAESERWKAYLSALQVPWAQASAGELEAITTEGRSLIARSRAERIGVALILEEPRVGRDASQSQAQTEADDRALAQVRSEVSAEIRTALASALEPGPAHQVLSGLGAAWS